MRKQKKKRKIKVPKLILINSKYFRNTKEVVFSSGRRCGKASLVHQVQLSIYETLNLVKKKPKLKMFLPLSTFSFRIKDIDSEKEDKHDYFNKMTAGADMAGGMKSGELFCFTAMTGLRENEEKILVVDNKVMVAKETKESIT